MIFKYNRAVYGYSLISMLVYLAMLLCISSVMFHYSIYMQTTCKKIYQETQRTILLSTLLDRIVHDIKHAPASIALWKICNTMAVVWTFHNHDIGWSIERGLLVRSEGQYNQEKSKWTKRTKSSVALPMYNVMLTVHYNATKTMVHALEVALADEENRRVKKITVPLINRVLV